MGISIGPSRCVTSAGYVPAPPLVHSGVQGRGRAWLGWIERLDWHSFPVSLCESR